jgi:predicted aconitase with swiveling domain
MSQFITKIPMNAYLPPQSQRNPYSEGEIMCTIRGVLKGRPLNPGHTRGTTVVSKQAFMFAHGVEPKTGNVIDVRSDIFGENVRGKVLVFPNGKGSTTGSAWLLEVIRQGNGPAAVINAETEPIIITALVMARLLYGTSIPLVDRLNREITRVVKKGDLIEVNGDSGEVIIIHESC